MPPRRTRRERSASSSERRPRASASVGLCLVALASVALADDGDLSSLREVTVVHGGVRQRLGEVVGTGPAVVAVWATYCPPCQAEVPTFEAGRKRWPELRFIALLADEEDPEVVTRVRREWGATIEVLPVPLPAQEMLRRLVPHGLPASFLIHDGRIERVDRFLDESALAGLVARLSDRSTHPGENLPRPQVHAD